MADKKKKKEKERTCNVPISVYNQGLKLEKEKGIGAAYKYYAKYFKKHFSEPPKEKTYKEVLIENAKDNRQHPYPAEERFKTFLGKSDVDYCFQVPVLWGKDKGYIIDFVIYSDSIKKDIAVEIDGGYHFTPNQMVSDKEREERLKDKGYVIVRLTNEETENNLVCCNALCERMASVGASDIVEKLDWRWRCW